MVEQLFVSDSKIDADMLDMLKVQQLVLEERLAGPQLAAAKRARPKMFKALTSSGAEEMKTLADEPTDELPRYRARKTRAKRALLSAPLPLLGFARDNLGNRVPVDA